MASRGRGRPPGTVGPQAKTIQAARLLASGAVGTKREAALAVGMHPSYFSLVTRPGNRYHQPEVTRVMDEIEQAIINKSVDLSAGLQMLGREALLRMRSLMNNSQNEAIVVKAAADLLDRSPETSKIHKHQVAAFSVSGDDAKLLAAAMVRSAEVRESPDGQAAASGDFVRVPLEEQDDPDALREAGAADKVLREAEHHETQEELDNARQGLLTGTPGQVDEGQQRGASALGSGEGQGSGTDANEPSASSAEGRPATEADAAQGGLTASHLKLVRP